VTTLSELEQHVRLLWRPPPRLHLSAWADQKFMLPPGDANAGRWHTLPYQREIMDAISDPEIERVTWMKSARVGYTKCFCAAVGYFIEHDPCPIMVVQPTLDDARRHSKEDIAPMLAEVPALQGLVAEAKAKDSSNTTLDKLFRGGSLSLIGANSPRGFRRTSRRVVIFDEVDGYPASAGGEGDPIELGIRRTEYYWNRKIIAGSTPTIAGASAIERLFEAGDQRRYYVPCPTCGTFQVLRFPNLKWPDGAPELAHLICAEHGCVIEHRAKRAMIEAGEWRAEAPGHFTPYNRHASFHLWAGYSYSPNATWGQLAAEFVKATHGGPVTLKTFVNTALGETWEDEGEKVEPHVLLARREPYGPAVPQGICCLVCAVDVQDDRLEVLVEGFGPGEEAWLVEARVIPGDPSRPEPWVALDELLAQPWPHASGAQLMILATAVDSAGHRTNDVYTYVRDRAHLRVYAIIGRDGNRPAVSAPSQKRSGRSPRPVPLFTLGVDGLKGLLYSRLRIPVAGPGYVHIPSDRSGFDAEFMAQLTAEKLVTRYKHGIPTRRWEQTRPRNEALDLAVYALGALRLLNPKLELMAERVRAAAVAPPLPVLDTTGDPADPPPAIPPAPAPPGRRVFRSSYMDQRTLPRRDWR